MSDIENEIEDELTYEELQAYASCTGSVDFETMEQDLSRMAKELLALRREKSWRPLPPMRQEMGG